MAVSSAHAVGLPSRYSAEAIEAWVIDAETKKPLEGVIVVAHWQLFYSTVGGRVPAGQLEIMETVTDNNGRFYFPAWGPKKVPKYKPQKGDIWIAYIPFLAPDGYLDDSDPALLLFKPGYEYAGLQNPTRSHTDHSPVRRSVWNGKTIQMTKFMGTPEEWFKMLERVVPPYEKPEEAKQSLMLRAILQEESSIPDSIERKPIFFNNIVRRLLEGR